MMGEGAEEWMKRDRDWKGEGARKRRRREEERRRGGGRGEAEDGMERDEDAPT